MGKPYIALLAAQPLGFTAGKLYSALLSHRGGALHRGNAAGKPYITLPVRVTAGDHVEALHLPAGAGRRGEALHRAGACPANNL